MRIGCTKKLLDYLSLVPEKTMETEDPLFSFSANLLTLNRRKCIVVMNDASCCGFLLYGVTAKDKKQIQQRIEAGLRNMLASENYTQNVIDRYIADCGFPAVICKTQSRSAVTRLNQFCDYISRLSGSFEPDDPFQTILLPRINDDIKINKDDKEKEYYSTYEALERRMRTRYGRVFSCRAGVFDIALMETPCVRRVTVPLDFSLFYLHDVIQQLFLWENYHIHDFVLRLHKNGRAAKRAIDPVQWDDDDFPPNCEILDESEVLLQDVFPAVDRIFYEYDFGDGWVHEIRLVNIIEDADIPAPVCELMTGDAPPEDCGGPHGFEELQKALKTPNDPKYRELYEWARTACAYQESIRSVNITLRRRYLAGAWDLYYSFSDTPDDYEDYGDD